MKSLDFIAFHEAALEADEIRHSLLVTMCARLRATPASGDLNFWTLGGPAACAMQTRGYPIVFGDLTTGQCGVLAHITRAHDYRGVVRPDGTALCFGEHAQ